MAENLPATNEGAVIRQEFGASEIQQWTPETAASAVAAAAKAAVEARYILAMRNPRDWEDVRVRIKRECQRTGFAESAWYVKPIGKGVEGFSIRFAEAALRCMRNCYPETAVVYESAEQRIIQVTVTDLESNLTYSSQIVIQKAVERSKVPSGTTPISQRTNSQGKITYLIPATEDDLLNKQNALISKALRTATLRLLPGDIQDECEAIILQTRKTKVNQDPDGEKKRIVDAFSTIGIAPSDLALVLGHSLDRVQPAELLDLRNIYTAIKEGETTLERIMESRGLGTGSAEAQKEARDRRLAEEREKAAAQKKAEPEQAEPAAERPLDRAAVLAANDPEPAGEPAGEPKAEGKSQPGFGFGGGKK